jgi:hypothetical protein
VSPPVPVVGAEVVVEVVGDKVVGDGVVSSVGLNEGAAALGRSAAFGAAVTGSGTALTAGEGAAVVTEGVLVGCVVLLTVGASVRDSSALGLSVSLTLGATAGVGTAGVGC